jgi:hypothetical protein
VQWVVPENIHTPPTEEISAVRRGRGEKMVSDNMKLVFRISEDGSEIVKYKISVSFSGPARLP